MRKDPGDKTVIRAVVQADAEELSRLWEDFMQELASIDSRFEPSDDALRRWKNDFRGWLDSDSRTLFVAEPAGSLIGFLSMERSYAPPIYRAVPEATVTEVFVTPTHRRRGVARSLLVEAKRWCTDRGVERIRLEILSSNDNALTFFGGEGTHAFTQTLLLELGSPTLGGPTSPKERLGFA